MICPYDGKECDHLMICEFKHTSDSGHLHIWTCHRYDTMGFGS